MHASEGRANRKHPKQLFELCRKHHFFIFIFIFYFKKKRRKFLVSSWPFNPEAKTIHIDIKQQTSDELNQNASVNISRIIMKKIKKKYQLDPIKMNLTLRVNLAI